MQHRELCVDSATMLIFLRKKSWFIQKDNKGSN